MLSVAEKAGFKVVKAPDFGGWSVDGGFKVMDEMLAKNPDIAAVFSGTTRCARAPRKRSRTPGGRPDLSRVRRRRKGHSEGNHVRRDELRATGQNNSDQIGRTSFNRLMAILARAATQKQTVLPSPIITKENAVKFYNPDSVF